MLHIHIIMRTFTHLATLNLSGFCKIAHTVFKIPKLLSIVIRNCDKKQLYTSCVCSIEPAGEGVNIKSSSGYALSPGVDKCYSLYWRFDVQKMHGKYQRQRMDRGTVHIDLVGNWHYMPIYHWPNQDNTAMHSQICNSRRTRPVNSIHNRACVRKKNFSDPFPAWGTVFWSKNVWNFEFDGVRGSLKCRRLLPHSAEKHEGMWSAEKIPKLWVLSRPMKEQGQMSTSGNRKYNWGRGRKHQRQTWEKHRTTAPASSSFRQTKLSCK